MARLDEIMVAINGLTAYDSNTNRFTPATLHSVDLVDDCAASRLFAIAAGPASSLCIIVIGDPILNRKLGGAQERLRYVEDLDVGGNTHSGVVITLPSRGQGIQRFGYLIRDLVDRIKDKPGLSAAGICSIIRPHLSTAIEIGDLLDDNQQIGLYGELLILQDMIEVAEHRGLDTECAFDPWQDVTSEGGEELGVETRRDFQGNNIVIEAKATSKGARLHTISNWLQLNSDGDEQLYIFSCAAKPQRGAGNSLIGQFRNVRTALGEDVSEHVLKNFHGKLKGKKFLISDLDKYELASTFVEDFTAGLIRIDGEIGYLKKASVEGRGDGSFNPGEGPESAFVTPRSISYELDLTSCTVDTGELIARGTDEYKDILYQMMSTNE
jgi:hypothetical protein